MKKFLCLLMAVVALACLAGCVDHNDGKCDECKESHAFQIEGQGKDELCTKCWIKKGVSQW